MKTEIPEALKADLPHTIWGRILSATPVVMTVVATMLAGLASSEMTRAQYSRSLAAQQQSKAGDQWSFFQAKRLRGALQANTLDLLQATTGVAAIDRSALVAASDGSPAAEGAVEALASGRLPAFAPAPETPAAIHDALKGMEDAVPDAELAALLKAVDGNSLETTLRAARDHATAADEALSPVTKAVDQIERQIVAAGKGSEAARAVTAARLRYNAQRYELEARLNQRVAGFLELQVRKSNIEAERHHTRSQRFFFGMLAAQAGVIIATFAMAARQRNLLWSLAAAAGLAAVAFAIYVYLYV